MYVAPLVGAWIEISTQCIKIMSLYVAPLVGAWIEILMRVLTAAITVSLLL